MTSSAAAQQFLGEELSPRALSLGGAFVGLADDASAAFWNPAGLANIGGFHLSGRLSMPSPQTPYDISGGALAGGIGTIGGSLWYGQKSVRIPTPEEQSLILIAVGVGVHEMMGAGATVKLYEHEDAGQRFRGTGIDLGLVTRFGSFVQGGITIADLLGTQLVSENGAHRAVSLIVRMGAALKMLENRVRLLGALDLARQEDLRAMRLGTEVQVFDGIALRVGWNGREFTWGVGIGISGIVQSDVAWLAGGWAISTELTLGGR